MPLEIEIAHCLDCGWEGYPQDLLSDTWEDYGYCPICKSDEIEIREMVYNDHSYQYEYSDEI